MGLYPVDCTSCGKPFMWFSGMAFQVCKECRDAGNFPSTPVITFTGGQSGMFQKIDGTWEFVIDGTAYSLDYLRRLIEEDAIKNHK